MAHKKWFVFENLNERSDRIVASGEEVVASIYTKIAGPFDTKEEAERARRDHR